MAASQATFVMRPSSSVEESSRRGCDVVEVVDFPLSAAFAPAVVSPTEPPPGGSERRQLRYMYTGAAVRRQAKGGGDGGSSEPRVDVIPHGKGMLELQKYDPSFADGTDLEVLAQYIGRFEEGRKHGIGSITVPGRYTMTCQWQYDVPELNGECHFANLLERTSYAGLLSMIADGTESTTSRRGFSGLEWASGVRFLPDSAGEMVYGDRKRYCGQWQCGQRHGFGILRDAPPSSQYFVGAFEFDSRHGSGTLYDDASNVTFCGMWSGDKIVGAGGLHLRKANSTIQGTRWNPGATGCADATILKSRNINGIWEPLFEVFDNNLATSVVQSPQNDDGEPPEDVVCRASESLLASGEFLAILSIFQRCFYFIWGSCGSNRDCGGGAPASALHHNSPFPSEAQNVTDTNLLSWCRCVKSPGGCVHKQRGRAITPAMLHRSLEDVSSFVFSVRLRLQSYVSILPEACDVDVSKIVQKLTWERVHSLVHPLLLNLCHVVNSSNDELLALSFRRCTDLSLSDFVTGVPSSEGALTAAPTTAAMLNGESDATTATETVGDASNRFMDKLFEECVGPLHEFCDAELDPPTNSLLPDVILRPTASGPLLSFPTCFCSSRLHTQFECLKRCVDSLLRLVEDSLSGGPSSPEAAAASPAPAIPFEESVSLMLRALRFVVLQCGEENLYSRLSYLYAISNSVDPPYPCSQFSVDDEPTLSRGLTPVTPSPQVVSLAEQHARNPELFALLCLGDAVEALISIYPSLRDNTLLVRSVVSGTVTREKVTCPVRPLADFVSECNDILGTSLFELEPEPETTEGGSTMHLWRSQSPGCEALPYTASPTFGSKQTGTRFAFPLPALDSHANADDKVLDSASLWLLQCVEDFLKFASSSEKHCGAATTSTLGSPPTRARHPLSLSTLMSFPPSSLAEETEKSFLFRPSHEDSQRIDVNTKSLFTAQAVRVKRFLSRCGILLYLERGETTDAALEGDSFDRAPFTASASVNTAGSFDTTPARGKETREVEVLRSGECRLSCVAINIPRAGATPWGLPLFARRQIAEQWSLGMHNARHSTKATDKSSIRQT